MLKQFSELRSSNIKNKKSNFFIFKKQVCLSNVILQSGSARRWQCPALSSKYDTSLSNSAINCVFKSILGFDNEAKGHVQITVETIILLSLLFFRRTELTILKLQSSIALKFPYGHFPQNCSAKEIIRISFRIISLYDDKLCH